MPSQPRNQQNKQSEKPQNEEAPKHQTGHQMDRKGGRDPGHPMEDVKSSVGSGKKGRRFIDSDEQPPDSIKKNH